MKKSVLIFITFSTPLLYCNVTFVSKGLSYDDVLLVPQKSTLESRSQVCTKTHLTKKIVLNMPIVSANMDTVTESAMAIAMAQLGGIGIIHRFNTIEQQVDEVKKVKRYRNAIIKNPLTVSEDAPLSQALELMLAHDIKGLLVIDKHGKLAGIITHRDIRFYPDENRLVKEFMTPRDKLVVGDPNISLGQAKLLLAEFGIEKLPLVDADNSIVGLITSKDIHVKAEYPSASIDSKGRLLVGAAIGVKDDVLERASALIAAGVDVLVIDVAHGHSDLVINTLAKVKNQFPEIEIIAGNVATVEGTLALIQAGADAIKVGIGPGSICTTRIVTGSGYPQLSAVIQCAQAARAYGVPVVADGGIRYSGDITKAIAGGAGTVMLGSLLAGTDESPGMPFIKGGKKYKVVRGMASFGAHLGRQSKVNGKQAKNFIPEGVEAVIPYKGSVVECVTQLLGGLYSGMSYCGVTTLEELQDNGIFVEITAAGVRESHPHDVQELVQ